MSVFLNTRVNHNIIKIFILICLNLFMAGKVSIAEERRMLRYGSDLKSGGLPFESVSLVAKILNWQVIHIKCPWKRCLLMMKGGNLDMIGGLFKTPERQKYLHYVEPAYFSECIVFYFPKGLGKDVKKYNDLKDLTIGVVRGVLYYEPFDSDQDINKYIAAINYQLFKLLREGRIDAFIGAEILYSNWLKDSNSKFQVEIAPYRVHAGNDYFGISKKSPYAKDRAKFEQVLKKLLDSGEVEDIYRQHGVEYYAPSQQSQSTSGSRCSLR